MSAFDEKLFEDWKSTFKELLAQDSMIVRAQMVHWATVTNAADYPVCAHCSELAGRLIPAPCPTFMAINDADAAMETILASDRYRHFTLNGFTQAAWDQAEAALSVLVGENGLPK